MDVVISDATVAPRFAGAGGVRLFPCETVVAVGQVKTKITSDAELLGALRNLRSATNLDRSGEGVAFSRRTASVLDHVENHLDRIFSFVFITGRALSSEAVRALLIRCAHVWPPHQWPNLICAFEKFLVTYACDDGVCPNTMHARGVAVVEAEPQDNLIRFFLMLARAVTVTNVAFIEYGRYLEGTYEIAPSDIAYAATADPPPLLSSLGMFASKADIEEFADVPIATAKKARPRRSR